MVEFPYIIGSPVKIQDPNASKFNYSWLDILTVLYSRQKKEKIALHKLSQTYLNI